MVTGRATSNSAATREEQLLQRVHDLEEVTWRLWIVGKIDVEDIRRLDDAGSRVAEAMERAAFGD